MVRRRNLERINLIKFVYHPDHYVTAQRSVRAQLTCGILPLALETRCFHAISRGEEKMSDAWGWKWNALFVLQYNYSIIFRYLYFTWLFFVFLTDNIKSTFYLITLVTNVASILRCCTSVHVKRIKRIILKILTARFITRIYLYFYFKY